jgi:hypothetical protein
MLQCCFDSSPTNTERLAPWWIQPPFAVQLRYDAFDDQGEPLDRPRLLELLQRLLDKVRCALGLEGLA